VIAQALAAQMLLMDAAVNHRNFDAAQIASAALLRIDYVRRVITLGIEGGGECEYLGGTEHNTEATGLATLDHNRNASFCHVTPTSGSHGSSLSIKNYAAGRSHRRLALRRRP